VRLKGPHAVAQTKLEHITVAQTKLDIRYLSICHPQEIKVTAIVYICNAIFPSDA